MDENGNFKGHVLFDSIRKIIFDPEQYDTTIEDIMLFPDYLITTEDSVEEIVKKFERSGNYNIAIVEGKIDAAERHDFCPEGVVFLFEVGDCYSHVNAPHH